MNKFAINQIPLPALITRGNYIVEANNLFMQILGLNDAPASHYQNPFPDTSQAYFLNLDASVNVWDSIRNLSPKKLSQGQGRDISSRWTFFCRNAQDPQCLWVGLPFELGGFTYPPAQSVKPTNATVDEEQFARETDHNEDYQVNSLRDKAVNNLIAIVSHEIRTPLNGILGMSQLLAETKLSKEQQSYVSALSESGQQLLTMANQILDSAQIRDGQMKLELMNFDLCQTMESAVEIMASEAHKKGLLIQSATGFNVPSLLRGDEGRIRQILINLISNAIKFTQSGSICIGAYWRNNKLPDADPQSGEVIISVIDTGPGIDEDEQSKIFRPFTQIDAPENRSVTGAGLGLSIVQDLVQLMGGEIKVKSEIGVGTEFWVRLPLLSLSAPELLPNLSGKRIGCAIQIGPCTAALGFWLDGAGADLLHIDIEKAQHAPSLLNHYDLVLTDHSTYSKLEQVNSDCTVPINSPWVILLKGEESHLKQAYAEKGATGHLITPLRRASFWKYVYKALNEVKVLPVELSDAVEANILQQAEKHETDRMKKTVSELPKAGLSENVSLTKSEKSNQSTNSNDINFSRSEPESAHQTPVSPSQDRRASDKIKEKILRSTRRILLADDNPVNIMLARAILEREGHSVDVVANGEEAVMMCKIAAHDLIFLDLHMPVMNGFDAAKAIRRLPNRSHTPIVALSADSRSEIREKALQSGMNDLIAKPLDISALKSLIQKVA